MRDNSLKIFIHICKVELILRPSWKSVIPECGKRSKMRLVYLSIYLSNQ